MIFKKYSPPEWIKDICEDMKNNPLDWVGTHDSSYYNEKKHVKFFLVFSSGEFIRTNQREYGTKLSRADTKYIKNAVKEAEQIRAGEFIKSQK
jgi:hypothetical protein